MPRLTLAILTTLLLLARPAAAEDVRVAVSIKPLYGIAAAVMEGAGAPELVLDGAVSPHDVQMRPSQMRTLAEADVVVWVGPMLEFSLSRAMLQMSEDRTLLTLSAANLPRLYPARAGVHEHHDEHHDDHAGAHEREAQELDVIDPHLWLDPANAAAIARLIAERLGVADPGRASLYQQNAEAFAARMDALYTELSANLGEVARDRGYVVFHDAYQYFEHAFGLRPAGAVAVDPDRPPGARTVMELHERIAAGGVACVFAEPQFAPQLVEALIDGTEARSATLDPLGADLPLSPTIYEELMRHLAADFAGCMTAG